jgi:hypothetical protein
VGKVEVVVDGDPVPAVRDLFIEAGAIRYTGGTGGSAANG